MQTTIIRGGQQYKVITQQYICGLYVAIYSNDNEILQQLASRLKEATLHKRLRKQNEWVPDKSTVIEG